MCKDAALDNYLFMAKEGQKEEFFEEVEERTRNTYWMDDIESKTIRVEVLPATPLEAQGVADMYGFDPELVIDTIQSTGLLIKFKGETHLLRDTAIKSLLDTTARLTGAGLSDLKTLYPEDFAEVLNLVLKVARKESVVCVKDGKVSAVLSDRYSILHMNELLETAGEKLGMRFGRTEFISGFMTHDVMFTKFRLPEYKEEIRSLYESLVKESVYKTDFTPVIGLHSSDTGVDSVSLDSYLETAGGQLIRINKGVKLKHVGATMEKYEQALDVCFAKFIDSAKAMAELSTKEMRFPYNAFMEACKKTRLPKKLCAEALETFTYYVGEDDSCSAMDIYMGISEILGFARRDQASETTVSMYEDELATILRFNWADLDMPGEHKWS